jgi:hypothetical protein
MASSSPGVGRKITENSGLGGLEFSHPTFPQQKEEGHPFAERGWPGLTNFASA